MSLYKVEYTYDKPDEGVVMVEAATPREAEDVAIATIEDRYAGMHQDPYIESIEEIKETV